MHTPQLSEWLKTLDLARVSITASLDPSGRLGPVGGLWPKLLAAATAAATLGLLRAVVVSHEQNNIAPELLAPEAEPLRVIQAATLQEAIEKLYEEHGPREAVRTYECERNAQLDLLGRMVPLDKYYQALPLLQEVKREQLPRSERIKIIHSGQAEEAKAESGTFSNADILRWEEELQGERISYEHRDLEDLFRNFRQAVKTVTSNIPRFIVLGPPGSGKTTLVQYLASQAAQGSVSMPGRPCLPVRVRLREWEAQVMQEGNAGQNLATYLTQRYKVLSFAPDVRQWQHWMQRGEVLLLLDGLDEIEGQTDFLSVLQDTLNAFRACPTVLTCRTVSFERHRTLCPDFPIFTLAGLDQEKRDAYIRTFPAQHHDQYEPARLIEQLDRSPQLSSLAANPLLLNIICYVGDGLNEETLPTTRIALYQQVIEKLLTRRPKRVEVRYPGEEPDGDEKMALLGWTALHLFAKGEQQFTFSGQELGHGLKQALGEEGYGDAPAPWANALRTDLTQNSGLLRGSPEQGFFFLHLTVQEFLVATALATLINERGWEAPIGVSGTVVSLRQLLDRKAWDPRWQEIFPFLVGQLHDPVPLLTLLANEKKADLFHCRLALAALCLPEAQAALHRDQAALVNRITKTVLSQWLHHECNDTDPAVSHLTRALPALSHVNGHIDRTPLLSWLCTGARDPSREVRAGMIKALGQMAEVQGWRAEIGATLLAALRDVDPVVRSEAINACRRMGSTTLKHPEVLSMLNQVALHDPNVLLRSGAARLLARLGDTSCEARPLPPPVNTESALRADTAESQGQTEPTAPADSEKPSVLVASLRSDDSGVRARAAKKLGQQGGEMAELPEVLSSLVQVALYDRDGGVRAQGVAALGQIGVPATQHAQVLSALAALLHDKDSGVRAQSAKALGQMGAMAAGQPEILRALLEALKDENSYVRFKSAEAFAQLTAQGWRFFRRWWGKVEGKKVEDLAAL